MRPFIVIGVLGVGLALQSTPSAAESAYDFPICGPWGSTAYCYFTNRDQCAKSYSTGNRTGQCMNNPLYHAAHGPPSSYLILRREGRSWDR